MAIIIIGIEKPNGKRGIAIINPDADAKTGRWCKAPLVPDRCYKCFDPGTLAHYPAEGYREEVESNGEVWRFGTCHRCQPNQQNQQKGGKDATSGAK